MRRSANSLKIPEKQARKGHMKTNRPAQNPEMGQARMSRIKNQINPLMKQPALAIES